MKTLVLRALCLLLFLLLPISTALALEKGQAAPDFELTSLEGKVVRLSDFKGQVVVLKLATTWCPTCKQQSGEIASIAEFLRDNQVPVIDVFLQDTEEMVRKALAEHEFPMEFHALLDDGQIRRGYNVYLIPRLLILDRDQVIRRDGSLITGVDLKGRLEELLAEGGGGETGKKPQGD